MKLFYIVGIVGIILIITTFLTIQAFLSVPKAIEACYGADLTKAVADVNNIQNKKINKEALCATWKTRIKNRVSCIDKVLAANPLAKLIGTKRDTADQMKQMRQSMCKDFPKTLVK